MSGSRALRSKTGVRRLHRETRNLRRPVDIAFLLQDWHDPYNVGGMFRVADAVGAAEIVLTGQTPCPPHPQISVTSLGNHRRVAWRHIFGHAEAAQTLKAEGYHLVAIEIAEGATPYFEYPFPDRVCLVLGSEGAGTYDKVMRECDGAVLIPMAGKGRSLNVHVAAAIVAFDVAFRVPISASAAEGSS